MDFSHISVLYKSLIAIGLALLIAASGLYLSNPTKIENEEIATGKAIEYVKLDSTSNRFPRIEFIASNGNTYTFVDSSISAMSKQQRTFEIMYDKNNPNQAIVYDKIAVFGLPIITATTGLGCLLFGFTVYRINRNKRIESTRLG